jgi:glycosyltransferase involved in cell wall biosynthesis
MTGIPVVAIGRVLANIGVYVGVDTYEVDKIIQNGVNGFCSDNKEELRKDIEFLFEHPEEAKQIGEAGRKTAIELFGKENIAKKWREFL